MKKKPPGIMSNVVLRLNKWKSMSSGKEEEPAPTHRHSVDKLRRGELVVANALDMSPVEGRVGIVEPVDELGGDQFLASLEVIPTFHIWQPSPLV